MENSRRLDRQQDMLEDIGRSQRDVLEKFSHISPNNISAMPPAWTPPQGITDTYSMEISSSVIDQSHQVSIEDVMDMHRLGTPSKVGMLACKLAKYCNAWGRGDEKMYLMGSRDIQDYPPRNMLT